MLFQVPAFANGNAHTQRIEHMKARKNIRTCIRPIDHSHQVYEYIIPLEYNRTKILSVRKYCGNNKKYCHPRKHKLCHSVKSRHIRKEKVQKCRSYKYKPEQIGNHKILDKRNMLIQFDL